MTLTGAAVSNTVIARTDEQFFEFGLVDTHLP